MLAKADFDIRSAIGLLNRFNIEVSFIVPTGVGLKKSILDATAPLRSYLRQKSIHEYNGQEQGPNGKKIIRAFFASPTQGLIETKASLYRPFAKGKEGDPRIWFSKLPSFASANNLLAVFAFDGALYLINISDEHSRNALNDPDSLLVRLFKKANKDQDSVASELLSLLKDISKSGWIRSITEGDTGIGATLEDALGIPINSSKSPDYKGIELKSKRINKLRSLTRSSLFAQVPDWSISKLKSSAEILDSYGYERQDGRRLYCTVRATTPNSQGLMLEVDEKLDLLHEKHSVEQTTTDVVSWKFDTLRDRLLTKHNETFWIGAESKKISGIEHFHYKKVVHTKLPIATNFHTLCSEGVITLDHLIKRTISGKVVEKGPLFKIHPNDLGLLFPPPQEFDLTTL